MEPFWVWNEDNVIWDVRTHIECDDRKVLLRVLTDLIDSRKDLLEKLHLPSDNFRIKETDDRIKWILNRLNAMNEKDRKWYGMLQVDTDLYAITESDDIAIVKDVFSVTPVESNGSIINRLTHYLTSILKYFKPKDQFQPSSNKNPFTNKQETPMKTLNANSLLPQHSLSEDQRLDISLELQSWLSLQGVPFTTAIYLSKRLISLAYQRRLELNSDEPIVEHLTLLAKQIALELDNEQYLLNLSQEKTTRHWMSFGDLLNFFKQT